MALRLSRRWRDAIVTILRFFDYILNFIIGGCLVIFAGYAIYKYLEYRMYPGLYDERLFHWSVIVFMTGIGVGIIVFWCVIAKIELYGAIGFVSNIKGVDEDVRRSNREPGAHLKNARKQYVRPVSEPVVHIERAESGGISVRDEAPAQLQSAAEWAKDELWSSLWRTEEDKIELGDVDLDVAG